MKVWLVIEDGWSKENDEWQRVDEVFSDEAVAESYAERRNAYFKTHTWPNKGGIEFYVDEWDVRESE